MAATEIRAKVPKLHADISLTVLSSNSKYIFLDVYCAFKNAPVRLWMKSAKYTRPLAWPNPPITRKKTPSSSADVFAHNKNGVRCRVSWRGKSDSYLYWLRQISVTLSLILIATTTVKYFVNKQGANMKSFDFIVLYHFNMDKQWGCGDR